MCFKFKWVFSMVQITSEDLILSITVHILKIHAINIMGYKNNQKLKIIKKLVFDLSMMSPI